MRRGRAFIYVAGGIIRPHRAVAGSTLLSACDKTDFDEAERGLIARPETLTIKGDNGTVGWDLEEYKKFIGLDKPAPDPRSR